MKASGAGETEADQVRVAILNAVEGFSMLDALVAAVNNKDRYTRRHSEDVMEYSLLIAREMGMEEGERHTVAVAALLHDVGKIGIPDHVLRKPGRLTEAEFEAVRQHPLMGAIIVQAVPGLDDTLDAVRHHHERWDGEGYPFGLRGEATPLMARLMAVADAFSAMTTDRPYRKGMNADKALAILEEGAGTQWDPECVGGVSEGAGVRPNSKFSSLRRDREPPPPARSHHRTPPTFVHQECGPITSPFSRPVTRSPIDARCNPTSSTISPTHRPNRASPPPLPALKANNIAVATAGAWRGPRGAVLVPVARCPPPLPAPPVH